jgi:molybdate transport system substrate-binding protein
MATLAALLLGSEPLTAADIHVFTSGAPAEVQKNFAPKFTEATGDHVVVTADTLNKIREQLSGGANADVIVLPEAIIESLDKAGLLQQGSRTQLARVGIGVAVREGAPLPDISTPDALRKTLLDARSIAYPDPQGGGFTGAQISRMLDRMGIADAVKPKVKLMYAFTGGVAQIATGGAELGLFNISEILPVKGVTLVGPLPAQLQNYIVFSGAVHVRSAAPARGTAYLRSLADTSAREAWARGGFELLGRTP